MKSFTEYLENSVVVESSASDIDKVIRELNMALNDITHSKKKMRNVAEMMRKVEGSEIMVIKQATKDIDRIYDHLATSEYSTTSVINILRNFKHIAKKV